MLMNDNRNEGLLHLLRRTTSIQYGHFDGYFQVLLHLKSDDSRGNKINYDSAKLSEFTQIIKNECYAYVKYMKSFKFGKDHHRQHMVTTLCISIDDPTNKIQSNIIAENLRDKLRGKYYTVLIKKLNSRESEELSRTRKTSWLPNIANVVFLGGNVFFFFANLYLMYSNKSSNQTENDICLPEESPAFSF